jgi:hypothetical protein
MGEEIWNVWDADRMSLSDSSELNFLGVWNMDTLSRAM